MFDKRKQNHNIDTSIPTRIWLAGHIAPALIAKPDEFGFFNIAKAAEEKGVSASTFIAKASLQIADAIIKEAVNESR